MPINAIRYFPRKYRCTTGGNPSCRSEQETYSH
jgi:hypothetical protein